MLETCLFKKIYFLKNRYQQEKNIVENYKESVWMTGCIQNIYIYIYIYKFAIWKIFWQGVNNWIMIIYIYELKNDTCIIHFIENTLIKTSIKKNDFSCKIIIIIQHFALVYLLETYIDG